MPSACTLIADMSPPIDPQVKAAKVAYKQRLSEAVQWLQGEGQGWTVANASRVYEVNEAAIRMALKRARQYTQQKRAQAKAIEAYCYEQWEMGMGATKKMVFAAICFLVVKAPPLII